MPKGVDAPGKQLLVTISPDAIHQNLSSFLSDPEEERVLQFSKVSQPLRLKGTCTEYSCNLNQFFLLAGLKCFWP